MRKITDEDYIDEQVTRRQRKFTDGVSLSMEGVNEFKSERENEMETSELN